MNKSRSKKKMVNISFTLPPDLESALEERARIEDRTKSQLIRQAIHAFIVRHEQKVAA